MRKIFPMILIFVSLLVLLGSTEAPQPTLEPLLLPESMLETADDDAEKGILYWQKTLFRTTEPEKYIGEPVEVLGFIYRREDDPEEVMFVGRMLLSCCYDDVIPQGLPVYLEDNEAWEDDEWVLVKGHWDRIDFDGTIRNMIIPESIEPTEIPEDPYIYEEN